MSSDPRPKDKKGLKAWLLRKRHKRDMLHLQFTQARTREEQRQEEIRPVKAPERAERKEEKEEIWSAKTQEIRNRLTDKKRMAAERWNRFAATEDAGGRGL